MGAAEDQAAQEAALYDILYGSGTSMIPEYTASHGGQVLPFDIGTLAQNLNYTQDFRGDLFDPERGLLSGYYNPGMLDGQVEMPMPERPSLPKLTLYSQSQDEAKQLMLARLAEGADPYQVALELQEAGLIPDQEGSTARFEATVKDATDVQSEIYAAKDYDLQMSQWTPPPSEFAKTAMDAGYSDPRLRYTDEQINPDLGPAMSKAASTQDAWVKAKGERNGIAARDALLQYAKPWEDTGYSSRNVTPEGYTNISRDGSPIERIGAAGMGAVNELRQGSTYVDALKMLPNVQIGKAIGDGLSGLFRRPDNRSDEEKSAERRKKTQEELLARVKADGGPGIGERVRTNFANFIQNNTTRRNESTARKNLQHAGGNYFDAMMEAERAKYRAALMQSTGRTPFKDELAGRAGL